LNEELASSNEELTAINEELLVTNEELQASNEDITRLNQELKENEALLRQMYYTVSESEERFRIMAEGTDVMIAIGDESGSAVYFNQAWASNTGRTTEELLKFGWVDLMHPEDQNRVMKIFFDAFQVKKPWEWEFRMPNLEGGYRWLLARGTPRFRSDGSFAGYISSTVDITEIKENEQRKNDFISMVSHELKTPLTSLSSYIQVLQNKARQSGDEQASGMFEKATKQTRKMTTLINGFLNVSRFEAAQIQVERTSFDLAELIQEIEEDTLAQISSHQVVFAPIEKTTVHADRDKIAQVIQNLTSNAVKYSPQGSRIDVGCVQTSDGKVTVSVKDEGIGISSEDLPKLFERYYRAKNIGMEYVAGFGIGLYLCCEILKRHEGDIWAESELGKGSTFYFTIPISQ
jgi:two-component system sensor histidine kinase VicK